MEKQKQFKGEEMFLEMFLPTTTHLEQDTFIRLVGLLAEVLARLLHAEVVLVAVTPAVKEALATIARGVVKVPTNTKQVVRDNNENTHDCLNSVSYTHLTLPTKA